MKGVGEWGYLTISSSPSTNWYSSSSLPGMGVCSRIFEICERESSVHVCRSSLLQTWEGPCYGMISKPRGGTMRLDTCGRKDAWSQLLWTCPECWWHHHCSTVVQTPKLHSFFVTLHHIFIFFRTVPQKPIYNSDQERLVCETNTMLWWSQHGILARGKKPCHGRSRASRGVTSGVKVIS